jgi:hypothetical protein
MNFSSQVEVFWVVTPNINTTQRHNPEDPDLKHHRSENLKTRFWSLPQQNKNGA